MLNDILDPKKVKPFLITASLYIPGLDDLISTYFNGNSNLVKVVFRIYEYYIECILVKTNF